MANGLSSAEMGLTPKDLGIKPRQNTTRQWVRFPNPQTPIAPNTNESPVSSDDLRATAIELSGIRKGNPFRRKDKYSVNEQIDSLKRTEMPSPLDREPPLDPNTYELVQLALQFEHENSGFLETDHPVTIELQNYLDKMKDPLAPSTRVLISINDRSSNAYSLPDGTIVISQSLINDMDSIEEIVAVLAHEQMHFEEEHHVKQSAAIPKVDSISAWIKGIGIGRIHENHADIGVNAKLDTLGMDTMAFASAIRKEGRSSRGKRSKEQEPADLIHGNRLERALNIVQAHAIVDFASSVQTEESRRVIPAEWKRSVNESILVRLYRTKAGKEYQELLEKTGPTVLREHIDQLVRQYHQTDKLLDMSTARNNTLKREAIGSLVEKRLRSAGLSTEDARRAKMLCVTDGIGLASLYALMRYDVRPADFSVEAYESLIEMHKQGEIYKIAGLKGRLSDFPYYLLNRTKFIFGEILTSDKFKLDLRRNVVFGSELSAERVADHLNAIKDVIARSHNPDFAKRWFEENMFILVGRFIEDNAGRLKGNHQQAVADTAELLGYITDRFGLKIPLMVLQHFSSRLADRSLRSLTYSGFQKEYKRTVAYLVEKLRPINPDFQNALSKRDSQAILQFLQANPEEFQEQLARFSAKASVPKELTGWILDVVKQNETSIPLEGKISLDDSSVKRLSEAGIDISLGNLSPEMQMRYQQIRYYLDTVYILTAGGDTHRRAEMIKKYIEEPAVLADLNSFPIALLDDLTRDIIDETKWHDMRRRVEEKFDLGFSYSNGGEDAIDAIIADLPIFGLIREKLLAEISDSLQLDSIVVAYTYFRSIYEDLYPGTKEGYHPARSFWGASSSMAREMAPLTGKLLEAFGRVDLGSAPADQLKTMYLLLQEYLPNDQDRNSILSALSERIVLNTPFDEAIAFIEQEALKGKMSLSLVDTFIEKRVFTVEDYRKCKDAVARITDDVISKPRATTGLLAIADTMIEERSAEEDTSEILEAMMKSGQGDTHLRSAIAEFYWRVAVRSYDDKEPILRGYRVVSHKNKASIIGPAAHTFTTLENVLNYAYNLSDLEKMLLLRKLLLSAGGVLTQSKHHERVGNMISAQLEQHPTLTPLLRGVFTSTLRAGDPVKIFTPVAQVLMPAILNRPSAPGSNDDAAQRVMNGIRHHRIDDIRYSGTAGNNEWTVEHIRELLGRHSSDVTAEVFAKQPSTQLMHQQYKDFIFRLQQELGIQNQPQEVAALESRPVAPIEAVIRMGQALGPPGVRFLQVMGQYFDIPAEYQERFRSVYDAVPGQSKYTAFAIIERLAKVDPVTERLFTDPSFRILKRIGGGSINTAFLIETRNEQGKPILEVLKAKNPNAERIVIETIREAGVIIKDMKQRNSSQRLNYEVAERMLGTIQEWVLGDIRDTQFMDLDRQFRVSHNGYKTPSGIEVDVPLVRPPYNDYLKLEEFVSGRTLNSLIGESKRQGVVVDTAMVGQAVDATARLFARQLTQPSYYMKQGEESQPVYLALSDVHAGNVMVISPKIIQSVIAELHNDGLINEQDAAEYMRQYSVEFTDSSGAQQGGIKIKPIDRTFYMQLSGQDVAFIREIVSDLPPEQKLRMMSEYFLRQPENTDRVKAGTTSASLYKEVYSSLFRARIFDVIKSAMQGRRNVSSSVKLMSSVLHELDKRNIVVPLKIRIMLKNIEAINRMQQEAGFNGLFAEYLSAQNPAA